MKYGWTTALTVAVLSAGAVSPPDASAVRAFPWVPGRTVVVFLQVGQTTEVVFPEEVSEFSNPEPQVFSIQFSGPRLLIKPTRAFEPTRLFALDATGRNFVVEFQIPPEGSREDDSVEISPEVASRPAEATSPGPNRLVLDLLKAMKLGRPIGGFQILEKSSELFYEEPRVVQMRLMQMYEGPVLLGYVVEIENISADAIRVNPQQFKMKGLVASSVTDMQLAPKEPKDTVESFKGYPKKTLAYVVVSKSATRR